LSAGADKPYVLRTTPTVRRAIAETLPEAVAAAAFELITGPLLEQPCRVGDAARVVTVVDIGHRRDIYRT